MMTTLDPDPTSEELVSGANEAFARGDLSAARDHLNAALQLAPDNGELALTLGHIKLNAGEWAAALADYTTAARLIPNLAAAHSSRALALQLLGQPKQAEPAAVRALLLNPKDTVAMKVLARMHLNDQNAQAARKFCRKILTIDPADQDAAGMLAQCRAAQTALPGNFHNGPPAAVAAANGSAAERALTPPASDKLQTLERLLGDYAARTQSWRALGAEHLLQQFTTGQSPEPISIQRQPPVAPNGPDGFPIPPVDLTMGYGAGDRNHYLATGRRSYEILSGLLAAQGISLERGDWMLDWGCAAGRAVRNFVAEASRGCHVWGCDVHAPSVAWAGNYLSPPFKFFNSSTLPHLPFPENRFKFIYGLSVFTHLLVMRDLWLLELHRVLSHDGCLILTIHDEHTWGWFRQRGMPAWMPSELRQLPELPGECVEVRGNSWEYCYTFFHSDYIRRVWGQYFKVAQIIPCADSYQAAVILRKS